MSNLINLLKVSFINDFGLNGFSKSISGSKEKKKLLTASGLLVLGVIAFSIMAGGYAYALAIGLEVMNMSLEILIMLSAFITTIVVMITSIYKAQGSLFSTKDYDMLMSLPIKSSTVLSSKMIYLLILNYIFTAIVIFPVAIVYFINGGKVSVIGIISLIIGFFLLPLIPIIISSLFAVILSYIGSRFKHKNIIITMGSMLVFVVIMIGSFKANEIVNNIINSSESIVNSIGKYYSPLGYFTDAVCNGSILALIKLILISIIPFVLFIVLFSKSYKNINGRLSENSSKANYKITSLKTKNQLSALTIRELRHYFSIPIYVMNTSVGMIMAIIASVATLFMNEETLISVIGQVPDFKQILPIIALGVLAFCIGLGATTCSAISLEGKNIWISKSLPIRIEDIFKSKIIVSLLMTVPLNIVANLLFYIGLGFNIKFLLFNLISTILFCVFTAIIGLIINLYFPKLEYSTPTAVVKQSASVLVNMVFMFIVIVVFAGIFIMLQDVILFFGVTIVILAIFTVGAWIILKKVGVNKFFKL